jgi:hypothetical protein
MSDFILVRRKYGGLLNITIVELNHPPGLSSNIGMY